MSRRHLLIAYDIADDKRRDKVFKTMQGQGDHAQFSVFLCQLNERELAELKSVLIGLVKHDEDQVLIADLGKVDPQSPVNIETIGLAYAPPVRSMIV